MKAIVVVSSMLPICILPSASSWAADREETIGRWNYLTIEDKMDDTTRYIAYVTALEGESVFIFKCDKPGPKSVYMSFIADQYLGEGQFEIRTFRYRIDSNPPAKDEWKYDGTAAYSFDKSKTIRMAESLMNASRLLVEALTYEYDRVEAEFDLTGGRNALDRLFRECQN